MLTWSRERVLATLILCGFCLSLSARADINACRTQSQDAIDKCDAASATVQNQKNADAGSAGVASSGSGESGKGFSLAGVTKSAAGYDNAGKNYCTPLKQSGCDTPCTTGIDPKDKETADGLKKKCETAIDAKVANFTNSANNLSGDSSKSKTTGDQASSSGLPSLPPMPQSASSPSPTPAATPASTSPTTPAASTPTSTTSAATTPQTPTATAGSAGFQSCSNAQAYLFSGCTSQLVSQCNNKYHTSAACESFASRYCSTSASSGQASSGAMKAGEGVASDFCKGYLAASSSFKCTSDTAICPSCTHVAPQAGATVPEACKMDPAFADPSLTRAIATASVGGGGSSMGGGLSGSSSGSAISAEQLLALENAKKAAGMVAAAGANLSTREGLSLGVDTGGGGSGSSYSFPDFQMPSHGNAGVKKRAVASNAAPTMSVASDVENLKGPSVFSISSEILRQRCKSGKLMHCGPQGK